MTDWHVSADEVLHRLTLPQLNLLSWARSERIRSERRWQMAVASLPLQESPQDFYDEVMGLMGDDEDGDYEPRESRSNSRLPYLHEINPLVAQAMGLPIKYVDVASEA